MNMFSTKEEVDRHVMKIFSVTKNQYNNDLQCYTIAKLYFDIKEYQISKNYIDRYIKTNENSKGALKLKGKIHENLNEYEIAQKCYQTLYDLFSEENDISKTCECLLKSRNFSEIKVKKLLVLLEKNYPNNENYAKLKKLLSPNVEFEYSLSEIDALKNQIKINANDDLKIRFLRILDSKESIVDPLIECSKMMDNFLLLDKYDCLKICLNIFRNNYKKENNQYKIYYSLILCSLLRNQKNICEYDRISFLRELMNLLVNESLNGVYKNLIGLFIYYYTSIAHYHSIKTNNLNSQLLPEIVNGYLTSFTIMVDDEVYISKHLSTWLKKEIVLVKSICSHFFTHSVASCNEKWMEALGDITFNNSDDLITLNKFSSKVETKQFHLSSFDQFKVDIACLSHYFMDLKTLVWMMMCYDDRFLSKGKQSNHLISEKLYHFIGSFVRKMFGKLPLSPIVNKKSPDNLCRIDIITFLLGALLTYQKSFNIKKNENFNHSFVYPFFMWQEIYIPEVIHKWWEAACDFCLNNKKSTSIGSLKELLKSGIDSLQLINNQMSEILRMQLGMVLYNCSKVLEFEADSIKVRSVEFYKSVLNPRKSIFRSYKFNSQTKYQNSVTRHNSFPHQNNSFRIHEIEVKELFDTDNVPEELLNQWRIEACLSVVDYYLLNNYTDYDELELLLEDAEKINETMPQIYLMKSRVYLDHAQSLKLKKNGLYDTIKFNELLKSAKTCVNIGIENLYSLRNEERVYFNELLLEQLRKLDLHSEYSIFEFSSIENNNGYNCQQNRNDDYSTVSNQSCIIDNFKVENMQSNIDFPESFQNKISLEISSCNKKMRTLTDGFENKIICMKNDIQSQNGLYLALFEQFTWMSKNFTRLEYENNREREGMHNLEKAVKNLTNTVAELSIENGLLKHKIEEFICGSKLVRKVIQPEMRKNNLYIEENVKKLFAKTSNQIQQIKLQELIIPFFNRRQYKKQNNLTVGDSKFNLEKDNIDKKFDIEKFVKGSSAISEILWKCKTCLIMNDKNLTSCPACQTSKSLVSDEKLKVSSVDFSKYTMNKWECKICCCMNDNNLTNCPACQTSKSSVSDEKLKVSSVDLSKYTMNKWECKTCCCMNDNNLTKCPACHASKSVVSDESLDVSTQDLSKYSMNRWKSEKAGNNMLKLKISSDNKEMTFDSISDYSDHKSSTVPKLIFGCQKKDNKNFIEPGRKESENPVEQDNDVIFVKEPFVTEDQKNRARELLLPDHFFYYENLPSNNFSDSESENTSNEFVNTRGTKSGFDSALNGEDIIDDDFDPSYEPIIELPNKIQVINEELDFKCVFRKRCKLFKYVGDNWKENGEGEMKIMVKNNDSKKIYRLIMREEKFRKVYCDQLIMKNCPEFIPMDNSKTSISWFAEDITEGATFGKEKMAIRFKTEDELKLFTHKILELQINI